MIYTLLVLSSPGSGHGARTAAHFAHAALARGHRIERIFFLDEGTTTGSQLAIFPQDEADRLAPWVSLAEEHGVELVLCIASALKHGVLDENEAARYDKPAASAHPAFVISGLGQLIDAAANADRFVTFGG